MSCQFARVARALVLATLVLATIVPATIALAANAGAPTRTAAADQSSAAVLQPIKSALDALEKAAEPEGQSEERYAELKRQLAPLRDEVRDKAEASEPQLTEVMNRLKQLGDPPSAGAAPEDPGIAAERRQLTQKRTELEAVMKQARLLALRADQLADRINERRRAIFTRELFARSAGLFDPAFWRQAVDAALDEAVSLGHLAQFWWNSVRVTWKSGGVAAAATLLGLTAIAFALLRWWRRRFVGAPTATRFDRALAALMVLAGHALAWPLVVIAVILVLTSNGLMPARIAEIGYGLGVAAAIAGFGRGVALGLFAPGAPDRRLIHCGEPEAQTLAVHLIWGGRLLGLAVFFNVVHKGISAPISLTVATSALLAVAIELVAFHLLLRFPRGDGQAGVRLAWLRAFAWLFVAAVTVALITGYIGFAAFLAGRVLVVLALLGALSIAIAFVDAVFGEVLTAETERGRAVAALLGITPRGMELTGTLLSALLQIVLVLLAFVPVLGQWGIFAADVFGVVQEAASGLRIGDVTISVSTILTAVAILLVGVLATRAAQRWLETRFLPRTGLDPGLQHSVSALFGYALFIAVLSLTLAEIGIDLQKIALVAGALSVGIGFGLQSVVSNFVSGLILLAERPIRVGDWVVVKAEEGWVRRISVRATEIETFDRATVIIPNSEFITGVVKNWTHSNTMGRIMVKVGVAYNSDVEQVRDLLLACAGDHAQVLQTPAPRVFLLGFGDSALEFELRCIVANVENALTVKSDLHFAVLARFRAAGIEIPYPQREVRLMRQCDDRADGPPAAG